MDQEKTHENGKIIDSFQLLSHLVSTMSDNEDLQLT